MFAAIIDRKQLKQETRTLLSEAQVSPKAMTALCLGIVLALNVLTELFPIDSQIVTFFINILISLMGMVLSTGYILYCMAIRRGERAELLTLFDGFSFVTKIIQLNLLMILFTWLWSMLFIIPGIIAVYRYRFAIYNLCENPSLSASEALNMSKRQTMGYKGQLLALDFSYFGWALLAGLPASIYVALLYQESFDVNLYSLDVLPVWGWVLVLGLWELVVSLFYLPHLQCVELGYFETAKRTSSSQNSAPDQLF